MAKQLRLKVTFPPVGAPDVVNREFAYKLGDADAVVVAVAPTTADDTSIVVGEGVPVGLTLTDIDDAGNRSAPRVQTYTAVDTLPPPMPGEMKVEVIEQLP